MSSEGILDDLSRLDIDQFINTEDVPPLLPPPPGPPAGDDCGGSGTDHAVGKLVVLLELLQLRPRRFFSVLDPEKRRHIPSSELRLGMRLLGIYAGPGDRLNAGEIEVVVRALAGRKWGAGGGGEGGDEDEKESEGVSLVELEALLEEGREGAERVRGKRMSRRCSGSRKATDAIISSGDEGKKQRQEEVKTGLDRWRDEDDDDDEWFLIAGEVPTPVLPVEAPPSDPSRQDDGLTAASCVEVATLTAKVSPPPPPSSSVVPEHVSRVINALRAKTAEFSATVTHAAKKGSIRPKRMRTEPHAAASTQASRRRGGSSRAPSKEGKVGSKKGAKGSSARMGYKQHASSSRLQSPPLPPPPQHRQQMRKAPPAPIITMALEKRVRVSPKHNHKATVSKPAVPAGRTSPSPPPAPPSHSRHGSKTGTTSTTTTTVCSSSKQSSDCRSPSAPSAALAPALPSRVSRPRLAPPSVPPPQPPSASVVKTNSKAVPLGRPQPPPSPPSSAPAIRPPSPPVYAPRAREGGAVVPTRTLDDVPAASIATSSRPKHPRRRPPPPPACSITAMASSQTTAKKDVARSRAVPADMVMMGGLAAAVMMGGRGLLEEDRGLTLTRHCAMVEKGLAKSLWLDQETMRPPPSHRSISDLLQQVKVSHDGRDK